MPVCPSGEPAGTPKEPGHQALHGRFGLESEVIMPEELTASRAKGGSLPMLKPHVLHVRGGVRVGNDGPQSEV